MNVEKIIDHLMEENKYYRHKMAIQEQQIMQLKADIEAMRERSRSKRIKKNALKRDNHQCVKCGSDEELHIHHKIPLSEGGEDVLDNVETLCIDCHIDAHDGETAAIFLTGLKLSSRI